MLIPDIYIKIRVEEFTIRSLSMKEIFFWINMKDILSIAKNKILVLDGAMGTMIQRYKLGEADFRKNWFENHDSPLKRNNDLLSLTRPDIIKDIHNAYFQERLKRAKIVRKRSNLNFFAFHFSSSIMQTIRNFFMKFLIKRKTFVSSYLGTVYKN